jgi:soluble cytochrome b562
MVERDYKTQPRFNENGSQGGMNSYFDKYDAASDSRNAVRELQSAVYEDKDTEGIRSGRTFLSRSLDNHIFNDEQLKAMVASVDSLKPLRDDYQKTYRGTSTPA